MEKKRNQCAVIGTFLLLFCRTVVIMFFLYLLSNVNASVKFIEFSNFGSFHENGTGITDALMRKDIELSFFSMVLTEKRFVLTSMTSPMLFTPLEIYYSDPYNGKYLGPDILLKPFEQILWYLIGTMCAICILMHVKFRNRFFVAVLSGSSVAIICLFYSSNLKAILTGNTRYFPFLDVDGLAESISKNRYRLVLNWVDDFRMGMIKNAGPESEFFDLKFALQKRPPIQIRSRKNICRLLLNDNRTAVGETLGMATIDVRHNMVRACGIHYRYLKKISARLYLTAGLMFAPNRQGRKLGEIANRYYDFLRGITGKAQEERKVEMEAAIARKEEELNFDIPYISMAHLMPVILILTAGIFSSVICFVVEIVINLTVSRGKRPKRIDSFRDIL